MAVRRDRDGRWRYRIVVKLPDGQVARVSGTPTLNTRVECERAERDHVQRALHPPPAPIEKKEVPTFAKFVTEQWLPTYPASVGNRPTSIREKKNHVRRHLIPALGRQRLHEIRGQVVDRFFADLRKPKPIGKNGTRQHTLSDKSIKNIRATLDEVLDAASRRFAAGGRLLDLLPKDRLADDAELAVASRPVAGDGSARA